MVARRQDGRSLRKPFHGVHVRRQETNLALSSFHSDQNPSQRMVSPMFGGVLSLQLNLSGNVLTDTTRGRFLP